MFSTFSGSSKRPRNVNLSGGVGNPFSNTSWTPAAVSNASQTVTNAQADREKRQADRQRIKAAGKIQRVWRGHKQRVSVADIRRGAFEQLYAADDGTTQSHDHLSLALSHLLYFFSRRRPDDLDRLMLFVNECQTVDLGRVPLASKSKPLGRILLYSLDQFASRGSFAHVDQLLSLITRLLNLLPHMLHDSLSDYYKVLGKCQSSKVLFEAIKAPLAASLGQQDGLSVKNLAENLANLANNLEDLPYQALASDFLSQTYLPLVDQDIDSFAEIIDAQRLASVILSRYLAICGSSSKDELAWLLARYIRLGRTTSHSSHQQIHLQAMLVQLSYLAPEIALRTAIHNTSDSDSNEDGSMATPFEHYINQQLESLVSHDGVSTLLQHLSGTLQSSSAQGIESTSLFASYISALLTCFPAQADDISMRLFLSSIPSVDGDIPMVKFLWHRTRHSSLVRKLTNETEAPVEVLRRFTLAKFDPLRNTLEQQEWQIALLFLEQYIFTLRLSDDEDFFSGVRPQLLSDNVIPSRIRSSNLSLDDLQILTLFLKNTAFCLHYRARDIASSQRALELSAGTRLDAYLASGEPRDKDGHSQNVTQEPSRMPQLTTMDLDALRSIITNALKMLYERDSRKQFLPTGHWLMTSTLDREDFIGAVIAEEERQALEDSVDSDDSDADEADDLNHALPSTYWRAASLHASRISHNARLERLRANQRRMQKERKVAELGPKLEILKHMPFVVPFETRVKIFRQFIRLDSDRRQMSIPPSQLFNPLGRAQGQIRRGHLFEDAYDEFSKLGEGFKDQIQITFLDEFGMPEAGVDGGGVSKEFLTSVISEAFATSSTDSGMFSLSDQGLLYPNPITVDCAREKMRTVGLTERDEDWRTRMTDLLSRYEFLGRIVGKCLYEGILVDLSFAGFFLLQWSSGNTDPDNAYKGSMNDLRDMDEELYNGMLRLKNYANDVSDLGIDFTIEDQISLPSEPRKVTTKRLIPNGDKTYVTNDNRLLYISYVARHRLVTQPAPQTLAFLRGLRTIIRPSWLSMFNQSELQRLVGGDSRPIDLGDFQRNIVYSGLYQIGDDGEAHPTINLFWKVLRSFNDSQIRDLIKYVTSTPRAPLLGFSQLNPLFSIRDGGRDESRLPSASTCVNLLKLPQYSTEKRMREKLLYAITSGAGFDLS